MKTILRLFFIFAIAAPLHFASAAVIETKASDDELETMLADPASLNTWLENHDPKTHADAITRLIRAIEKLKITPDARAQLVALTVARVVRTDGAGAADILVAVASNVSGDWLPVMVAAATLVGNDSGLAAQKALIVSSSGNAELEARAKAAAKSPSSVPGADIVTTISPEHAPEAVTHASRTPPAPPIAQTYPGQR